jgi:hypothetical protein
LWWWSAVSSRDPIVEGLTGTSFAPPQTGDALANDQCKIGVLHEAGLLLDSDRDDDRLRLIRYVLDRPESALFAEIWRDVFGKTGPVDPSDPDYQLVRRFYTHHPEFFEVSTQNGMTAVESSLNLFDLISQGIVQKRSSEDFVTDREFCRSLLASTDSLADSHKEILDYSLRRYVDRINDWRLLFEMTDVRTGRTTKLIKPYATRFSDQGRIAKQWARFRGALGFARENYENAVMATLTTDPKQFDSLAEAIDEIMENFNRLLSWMAYQPTTKPTSRPGYRPNYLCSIEFSEAGYPHLHVVFFDVPTRDDGMPWLIDKNELSNRWEDLGQGEIVDTKPLIYVDDLPENYDEDEGFVSYYEFADAEDPGSDVMEWGSGTTAGQYLGKYLSATFGGIMEVATDGGINVEDAYEDKSAAYKVAIYWATGKRLWTLSKEIEQGIELNDDTEVPLPVIVRFLGVYPFWDLPISVTVNSRPFREYVEARYPDRPASEGQTDRPPP